MRTLAIIFLLAGTNAAPVAALGRCGSPGELLVSDPEGSLAKARRCAAGDADACRTLDWVVGAGPADLREIPADLAAKAEGVLAQLCAAKDDVACHLRAKILERLGREEDALALHRAACADSWPQCLDAAALELKAGKKEEALRWFTRVCDGGYDGDAGESCGCAGSVLESMGRKEGALTLHAKGCAHGDNESCAAARRLSGRPLGRGSWEGLYRSKAGTLWIAAEDGGSVSVRMSTAWANGHTCSYSGRGTAAGDALDLEPVRVGKDECRPVLRRLGREVSVEDPEGKCRSHCGARGSFEERFVKVQP